MVGPQRHQAADQQSGNAAEHHEYDEGRPGRGRDGRYVQPHHQRENEQAHDHAGAAQPGMRTHDGSPDALAFGLELDVGIRFARSDQLHLGGFEPGPGGHFGDGGAGNDFTFENGGELAVGYFAADGNIGHGGSSLVQALSLPEAHRPRMSLT